MGAIEVMLVEHKDGSCMLAPGHELDPDAWNDPTACGHWVALRFGSGPGVPSCPECLLIAEGRAPAAVFPSSRAELEQLIAALKANGPALTLPAGVEVWLNHGRYWLKQADGTRGFSQTPAAAAQKAWRLIR